MDVVGAARLRLASMAHRLGLPLVRVPERRGRRLPVRRHHRRPFLPLAIAHRMIGPEALVHLTV